MLFSSGGVAYIFNRRWPCRVGVTMASRIDVVTGEPYKEVLYLFVFVKNHVFGFQINL